MFDDSLLPSNSTPLERAIERLIAKHFDVPVLIGTLWNPDTCPAEVLTYLAWAFSVDHWDPEWPEQTRRDVIRNAVEIHRWKGTLRALKHTLKTIGYGDAIVTEAKELMEIGGPKPLGDTWRLGVTGVHWADYWIEVTQPITLRAAAQLAAIASTVVPVRCRLRAITVRGVQFTIGDGQWTLGRDVALGATYFWEALDA